MRRQPPSRRRTPRAFCSSTARSACESRRAPLAWSAQRRRGRRPHFARASRRRAPGHALGACSREQSRRMRRRLMPSSCRLGGGLQSGGQVSGPPCGLWHVRALRRTAAVVAPAPLRLLLRRGPRRITRVPLPWRSRRRSSSLGACAPLCVWGVGTSDRAVAPVSRGGSTPLCATGES